MTHVSPAPARPRGPSAPPARRPTVAHRSPARA